MTNQKTIWIINQYSGSSTHGMEYRHYYLAKEFIAKGHNVVMISGSYSHLFKQQPNVSEAFTFEKIDGISYCWVKVPKYERSISLGRFKNMMAFAWNLRKFPITDFPKPDAIIVSSPSLFPIVIARKWATKFKAKLLFEIRDIWPLTLQELSGLKKWHPVSILLSYFEKYGYKNADKVISLLPDAYLHFEKFGMSKSKFHYIPNGISLQSLDLESTDFVMNIPKDKFIIGYVGSMGKSNALEYYIEAINNLSDHQEIAFVFIGKGAEKASLKNATVNKNVIWIDAIEKGMVQSALSQMDACYIGWHNIKLYEMGISANKIFDYMYAAKPIIHSNNASNDLVKLANCGLSIPAENPQAIANAILHLSELPLEERNKLGQNGKDYVLRNHTYSKLADKYLELI
ncbi:MAG: glycosyltransferase family 4 protein [Bacteroidota bacterium]